VGVQPFPQVVDFRLDDEVPLNIVSKVAILSELMVLLEKCFAVCERPVVVSNNFTQRGEIPVLLERQTRRSRQGTRLLGPGGFCIFNNAIYVVQILCKVFDIVSKVLILIA
jgi:hypothetical protein